MKKVIVRYLDPETPEETLIVGKGDELLMKQWADGKSWVDADLKSQRLAYEVAKRTGRTNLAFEQWLNGVAEVEPRMSLKDVDDAEGLGEITPAQAEFLRTRIRELGDDPGESAAPRS